VASAPTLTNINRKRAFRVSNLKQMVITAEVDLEKDSSDAPTPPHAKKASRKIGKIVRNLSSSKMDTSSH
jgi:predicted phage-related endonuclease